MRKCVLFALVVLIAISGSERMASEDVGTDNRL